MFYLRRTKQRTIRLQWGNCNIQKTLRTKLIITGRCTEQGVELTISCNGVALKNSSIRSFQYRHLRIIYTRIFRFESSKSLELKLNRITWPNKFYLSNGVHLKKLWAFIWYTHLKIFNQFYFDASVLRSDKCLKSIFVCFPSMQNLEWTASFNKYLNTIGSKI